MSVAILSRALHINTLSPPPFLLLHLIFPLGPLVVRMPVRASIDFLVYVSVPVVGRGKFSTRFCLILHSAATSNPFANWNRVKGVKNDEKLPVFTKGESTGVSTSAPSADLNEFNCVCVLHLGPGPCGTLSFSLHLPPGITAAWCWVERSRVNIQSA